MSDQTADEAVDLPAEAGGSSTNRKKKLLLLMVGGVVLLGVTGAVLYVTGIVDKLIGHNKSHEMEKAETAAAPAVVFYDLPDLLVNLNSTGRKASFLKLSVSLEVERAEDLPRLQAIMPRVVDNFQVYLRELRVEDLHGSGGIYRLREELLARVNAAAAPVKVVDVLFKEMLVQ
jgi:flagellar protein FliL